MPFEQIIERSNGSFIENQLLIWSILHYVPFKQLTQKDIYVLFYENLFCEPERELSRLFGYLYNRKSEGLHTLEHTPEELLKLIYKPSRTENLRSSTLSRKKPLDAWKDDLSSQEIDSGFRILAKFGLDSVYGNNSMPNERGVDMLFYNSAHS